MPKTLTGEQYEAVGRFLVTTSQLEYQVHQLLAENDVYLGQEARIYSLGDYRKLTPALCHCSSQGDWEDWQGKMKEVLEHRNHIAHGYHHQSLANPHWIVVLHTLKSPLGRIAGPTYSVGPVLVQSANINVVDLNNLTVTADSCWFQVLKWKGHHLLPPATEMAPS